MNELPVNNKEKSSTAKTAIMVALLLFVAVAIIVFAMKTFKKENPVPDQAKKISQPAKSKVIVYYFHGTQRCESCIAIENYSKETVKKFFANELGSGKLEFIVRNVDLDENKHFVQDYKLTWRSLVVVLIKNGKEIKYENLFGVWTYKGDKEQFYKYVKDAIDKYLKEV